MVISVKDFMTFIKKARDNEFLTLAFKELIASQNDGQEIKHLERSIYNLEIAVDKKSKEDFYKAMTNKRATEGNDVY